MMMKTVSGVASRLLLWGSLSLSVLRFLPLVVGGQDAVPCSFPGEPLSLMNDQMTFQHVVNVEEGTITVEIVYDDIGWVAFGTSPNGLMIGGQVVIALPDDAPSSTNPGKYSLVSKSDPVQSLMGTSQQTLINAAFEQTDGQTIMRFTKFLTESDEYPIDPTGSNTFIFAAGSGNTFGYHGRNSDSTTLKSLKTCGSTDTSVEVDNSSENHERNLWVAHGILMAIAWAILLPLGIGFSLLRSFIPGQGLWFKLHMFTNGSAFLLMTAAFGIAVYMYNEQGDEHFQARHQAIGLTIYILSFVQILGGIFRPHLPGHAVHAGGAADKQPEDKFTDSVDPASDDDEDKGKDASSKPADSNPDHAADATAMKKSKARIAFEVGHRILGFGLLGLAWYNCYLGIDLLVESYGEAYDKEAALWGVIGGLSGAILLGYVYKTFIKKE